MMISTSPPNTEAWANVRPTTTAASGVPHTVPPAKNTTVPIRQTMANTALAHFTLLLITYSLIGAPGRTRTHNLRGRSSLLYPVEIQGHYTLIATRCLHGVPRSFYFFQCREVVLCNVHLPIVCEGCGTAWAEVMRLHQTCSLHMRGGRGGRGTFRK